MPKETKAPKQSITRGPKPEVLTIPGKWEDAVKTSLSKKKPVNGWPK
jgi:hypothetical protein